MFELSSPLARERKKRRAQARTLPTLPSDEKFSCDPKACKNFSRLFLSIVLFDASPVFLRFASLPAALSPSRPLTPYLNSTRVYLPA